MMKHEKRTRRLFATIVVAVLASSVLRGEVKTDVNLVPATRAVEKYPTISSTASQGTKANANYLFDGLTWTTVSSPDYRWLVGSYKSNGADPMGTRVVLKLHNEYEPGSRIVLKRYRLFRCPYWGNKDRFITKWSVWGIPDGAGSDTNLWQKLDERIWPVYDASLTPNCWPNTTNASEGETNSFDCATIVPSGFRGFAFVPQGSSLYDQEVAGTKSVQDNDMELYEIEYDVDIYDYPVCSITNDLDFAIDDAQAQGFSPANGASLNVSQTVSAPEYIHEYPYTYRTRGYRIEGYDRENSMWTNRLEVTDGSNLFVYEVPEDPSAQERVVWLYERKVYYTEANPIRLSKYLEALGVNGSSYTWWPDGAGIGEGHKTLFDGVTYLLNGDWRRWYGSIKKGARSQLTLPSASTGVPLYEGDLFYFSKYRIYMTSMGSNERTRAPTAWTLKTGVGTGDPETTVDTRSGIDWSAIPFSTRGANYQEFELSETASFSKILFTPTDSGAHQSNPDANITVSLLEVDIWGNVANPKGTLRVLSSRSGVAPTAFAPALGTLLENSGTLSAPTFVRENGERYPCVGYRLEWFDEAECLWKLDHESDQRTYSFTPNSEKAYRLVWGIGYQLYGTKGMVVVFK